MTRTTHMRALARDDKVRSYFYGLKTKFHPHCIDVKFSQLKIYKIGAPQLPDSCMPCDMKVDDHRTKLVPVEPSKWYTHGPVVLNYKTEEFSGKTFAWNSNAKSQWFNNIILKNSEFLKIYYTSESN